MATDVGLVKSTLLVMTVCLVLPLAAWGVEAEGERTFTYTVNTLIFGNARNPSHSSQNPDNAFLNLNRYSAEIDLRPDVFLDKPNVSALLKPRFTTEYKWWEDGEPKGRTDTLTRAFVNEWRVQMKTLPVLFVSFGKEKLLWGPSFLASPSNILFKDTEKVNPKTEVEGKYLAKAIFVPNNALTITAVRETQNEVNALRENVGHLNLIKADLLGSNYLVSAIGYYRPHDRFRFGSFGQWTASDALVLYYDGIVTKGTDALYPVEDPGPFGGSLGKKYEDSSRLLTTIAVGGSYTFLSGSTMSLEYLFNQEGYDDAQAEQYYRIRRNAHDHYFDAGPLAGLSRMTLNETLNIGMPFFRRQYLMAQYQVREIKNVLDVIVRYVHSLDEDAGQASTILEWQITKRMSFFNINMVAVGHGKETEFNSVLRESYLAGVEVHF